MKQIHKMKYFGLFILAVMIQFVFGHEAAGKESENKKPTKDKNICKNSKIYI